MAIEKLSEDLLMEILWRLPIKTILRSKSVCKNWYALIQNPTFIYLHHDRAISIAASENTDCLLVKRYINGIDGYGDDDIILSFVPNETPTENIFLSFTGLEAKTLHLLGPCNGVVCLTKLTGDSSIVLWNPSMKEFRVLPEPSYKHGYYCNLGFGFDPYTNDYKVVRFALRCTDLSIKDFEETVEIYYLSTDSWREVNAESPIKSGFHCDHLSSTSWNGDFSWYADRYHGGGAAIVAFSMTEEVFEEMPVPEVCLLDEYSKKELFVLNESLAMVIYPNQWSYRSWFLTGVFGFEKCFDIWVMNKQDAQVCWTKKFTIGPFRGLDWALGFRKNGGEFLVENGCGQMMSYNLDSRKIKEYQVYGRPPPRSLQVLLYTESLVSVKRQ